MAVYATWKRADGLPSDPLIRPNQRIGATILKSARNSVVVTATVAEWERCTGTELTTSGGCAAPGAPNLIYVAQELEVAPTAREKKTVGPARLSC